MPLQDSGRAFALLGLIAVLSSRDLSHQELLLKEGNS